MSQNIIVLDIDGVLLSGKEIFSPHNQSVDDFYRKQIKAIEDEDFEKNNKIYNIKKKINLDYKFDSAAIGLINRLAEKSEAKIVLISNWRRHYSEEDLREKLIKEGLEESFFHEKFIMPMRIRSSKMEDLYSWVSKNDKQRKNNYVVIDDEFKDLFYADVNGISVKPNFDNGFSLDNYRVSAGYLGVEDLKLGVPKLTEVVDSHIKQELKSNPDLKGVPKDYICKVLFSKGDCGQSIASLLNVELAKEQSEDFFVMQYLRLRGVEEVYEHNVGIALKRLREDYDIEISKEGFMKVFENNQQNNKKSKPQP